MMGAWLAGGAAASLALAAHPYTTYPLSLRVLARRRAVPILRGTPPTRIAMCVCAYNEESVIAARVENMLALRARHPGLDILVYVDAASDGTARVLDAFRDRIRVVVSPERHGKTYGMNLLVSMVDAEIIVFSDANVAFAPDAIEKLIAPFADPAVGCSCGHLVYLDGDAATSTAAAGSLYWRLEEYIKALESETGSVMGADGSIFALRRSVHRPPPPYLIDDMFVSLSALCAGSRIVRVADAIATEASVSRPAEEFRRKVRIACQAFNVNRALWPELMRLGGLDRYKYLSHKYLRWLTIYLLAASFAFSVAAIGVWFGPPVALLAAALATASGGLVATSHRGPLGKLREVLAAFTATGLGVWRSWRGETFQTWNPPASARASSVASFAQAEAGA
jgi:cellulose synthase/poly-beta-1,6-N-acetylglucosamine synthase-like glycosyltransferase